MKKARAIPILSGAAAAALAIMTATPALAGPAGPRAAGRHAVRSILQTGTAVTGVRGSGGRGVVLTGTEHIRVLRRGGFGRAQWRAVPVSSSALCPCKIVTGNTVWRNRVMGLYVNSTSPADRTYLALMTGP